MVKNIRTTTVVVILVAMLLSSCSGLTLGMNSFNPVASLAPKTQDETAAATAAPLETAAPAVPLAPSSGSALSMSAFQGTLEGIYEQVSPSVVNLRVVEKQTSSSSQSGGILPGLPNIPGFPDIPFQNNPDNSNPDNPSQNMFPAVGEGSGFVWDKEGHIVTNNHVVEGSERVTVTFADQTSIDGKVIGTDPDSDLAVVKVDLPAAQLKPVQMADSTRVKIGQIAIAIGNPFGLEGTMTFGIVSALGRSLPVDSSATLGSVYTIPDVIQTDAPINPGNSGGPLIDADGKVIGVTAAIESPVRASAGVGFVIPAAIVNRVVPALIKDGKFQHTWVGISGTTVSLDIAKAMNLKSDQHGALVIEVSPDSPAEKAKLQGSSRKVNIEGQQVSVGGDIILKIDDQSVKSFDDLTTYLARSTEVGQTVTLTVLRDGKEEAVKLTLAARPASSSKPVQEAKKNDDTGSGVRLGIAGLDLTSDIAKGMGLASNQKGVLVQQVQQGSLADKAGLLGSFKPMTINGDRVMVGGDVITGINDKPVEGLAQLKEILSGVKSGDQITLKVLRDNKEVDIKIDLGG